MSATASKSPNLLFIFTDQQRWDACGCYGGPMNLTPNLDAMAGRGVRFESAFTCQPVCAPARGCLQTGKHATAHSVWRNGLALPQQERTLAHHFSDAGYDVGYLGKWHLSGDRDKPVPIERRGGYEGYWEAADVLEFTSHPYDCRMFGADNEEVCYPGYRVDAITDRAIEFIGRERDDPFFLFVSYLEPHHQNDWNAFVPPDEYKDAYKNPYVPPDLRARPGNWQEHLPGYYGMIRSLDDNLGRMLAALEDQWLTEDTIVVFTSDHGCHFATRNSEYKRSCHEGCIRIPMVMRGPGVEAGHVAREIVSLIDLPPTILSAAGLPAADGMHGRDAMPLTRGDNADWANEAFLQISEYTVGRAIRTERWKYCVHDPHKNGWEDSCSDRYVEHHLYDLCADPWEQVNLIGRKEYDAVREDLKARLIKQMLAAGEDEPQITDARFYE